MAISSANVGISSIEAEINKLSKDLQFEDILQDKSDFSLGDLGGSKSFSQSIVIEDSDSSSVEIVEPDFDERWFD
jgi:hypothetical protein